MLKRLGKPIPEDLMSPSSFQVESISRELSVEIEYPQDSNKRYSTLLDYTKSLISTCCNNPVKYKQAVNFMKSMIIESSGFFFLHFNHLLWKNPHSFFDVDAVINIKSLKPPVSLRGKRREAEFHLTSSTTTVNASAGKKLKFCSACREKGILNSEHKNGSKCPYYGADKDGQPPQKNCMQKILLCNLHVNTYNSNPLSRSLNSLPHNHILKLQSHSNIISRIKISHNNNSVTRILTTLSHNPKFLTHNNGLKSPTINIKSHNPFPKSSTFKPHLPNPFRKSGKQFPILPSNPSTMPQT